MLFLYFIILIIPSTLLINPSIDFEPTERNQITTKIAIGTPPQYFTLLIDTSSLFSWIYNSSSINDLPFIHNKSTFNSSISSSFIYDNSISLSEYPTKYNISGNCGKDTITFNNDFTLTNFSFCIINNSIEISEFKDIDGILSIPYSVSNYAEISSYFLIEQLYLNNIITHKQFSIKYHNEYKGKIIFGKSIIEQQQSELYNVSCFPNHNSDLLKWKCLPIRYEYGDIIVNSTKVYAKKIPEVYFDTSTNYVIVDMEFYNGIKDKFFKNAFAKGICEDVYFIKDNDAYNGVSCNKSFDISEMGNVYILFDNWNAVELNAIDMIQKKLDDNGNVWYEFQVISKYGMSYYVIGLSFIKNFEIAFHIEGRIDLSSRDRLVNLKDKNKEVIGFTSVIGIVLLVIVKCAYKLFIYLYKKKKETNEHKDIDKSKLNERLDDMFELDENANSNVINGSEFAREKENDEGIELEERDE